MQPIPRHNVQQPVHIPIPLWERYVLEYGGAVINPETKESPCNAIDTNASPSKRNVTAMKVDQLQSQVRTSAHSFVSFHSTICIMY